MTFSASESATADVSACGAPLTGGVLTTAAAGHLASAFKALADPARVKLVSLTAASYGDEPCICDLT